MEQPAILFENVTKQFPNGHVALKNVSLSFKPGEFVVVVGLSGAGKSTLIRCVNRLVTPTSGRVSVAGVEMTGLNETGLRAARARIGMIFQNYNLVRRSSVLRNVLAGRLAHLPSWRTLLGNFPLADVELALRSLDRVGIMEKAYQRADTLSGGQQQRVAIARALAQQPTVLLADEPVASLDPPTAHQVMRDLKRLSREENLTTLVNLHFIDMAQEYADRIVGLRAGEVVFDGPVDGMSEGTFEEIYNRRIRPDDLRGTADLHLTDRAAGNGVLTSTAPDALENSTQETISAAH
ncbi:MAG: phosphonate ABC transporter ATP-binding protein [Abitibacteriaceae bacterium]|nr:phosphonate ABC transporter ATP-binding protein [Abditibacteriaceae bacterium]